MVAASEHDDNPDGSPRSFSRPAMESQPEGLAREHMAASGKLEEDLYSDIDPTSGGSRPPVNAAAQDDSKVDGKDRNGHQRCMQIRLIV